MRDPQIRRGGAVEITAYVLVASLLCVAAAAPALLGVMPRDIAGLVVPVAQLTPFLTALIFWAVMRPGTFTTAFAMRWSWAGVGIGVSAVAVISAAQLIAGLTVGEWQVRPLDMIVPAVIAVVPFLVLQSVFAIGEELGWRGWLATRTARYPFSVAATVSAVAWAFWHLPAVPLIVVDGDWQRAAAYLLAIMSWAPFLLALRQLTGSVWAAVVAHGALNSIRVFFTQSVASSSSVSWPVEAIGWVAWLGAAVLLVHLARRQGPPLAGAR
ncbi:MULTISPECIES: CPBP family intramembrane glutamic endopeptidase [Kocuria]|uniref:CPBP family intramembrane metalloprotease n=1 Tax=Kocuria subflava TaxID=1736139 RepID=A0A846U9U0_9MICC|nr:MULTISPECIES: CPBP family intramembrane glutamic endopeptidase [Kocuria]NKE10306.1 CPBP family intramembrane metalloprotease [Kocuria subflava]